MIRAVALGLQQPRGSRGARRCRAPRPACQIVGRTWCAFLSSMEAYLVTCPQKIPSRKQFNRMIRQEREDEKTSRILFLYFPAVLVQLVKSYRMPTIEIPDFYRPCVSALSYDEGGYREFLFALACSPVGCCNRLFAAKGLVGKELSIYGVVKRNFTCTAQVTDRLGMLSCSRRTRR